MGEHSLLAFTVHGLIMLTCFAWSPPQKAPFRAMESPAKSFNTNSKTQNIARFF